MQTSKPEYFRAGGRTAGAFALRYVIRSHYWRLPVRMY